MGAAAIILIKERQIVEAFERVRATSTESARSLDMVGVDSEGLGMRRLRERAVIREATPGHYYLDVEVWQAVRRQRHRIVLVILVLIIAAAVAGIVSFR